MNNRKQAYSQKLLDPRWQKKRLEIFQRDDFTCQSCGNNENTLHVHHKYYEFGKEPWEYNNNMLITLCAECHEWEEYCKTDIQAIIRQLLIDGYTYANILQYISGLQMPLAEFDCKERVQLASFCASVPEMLSIAKEKIDNNWSNFFDNLKGEAD